MARTRLRMEPLDIEGSTRSSASKGASWTPRETVSGLGCFWSMWQLFRPIPNVSKQPMSTTSLQSSTAVKASPLKVTGTDAMSSAKGFKHGSFKDKESPVSSQILTCTCNVHCAVRVKEPPAVSRRPRSNFEALFSCPRNPRKPQQPHLRAVAIATAPGINQESDWDWSAARRPLLVQLPGFPKSVRNSSTTLT